MDLEELTSLEKPRQPPGLTLTFCLLSSRSRQGSSKRNTRDRDEDSKERYALNESIALHGVSSWLR